MLFWVFSIWTLWFIYNVAIVSFRIYNRLAYIQSHDPEHASKNNNINIKVALPISGRRITAESFKDGMKQLRHAFPDKKTSSEGIFGCLPASSQQILKESCSMLGGLSAALSQLAHPFVAYAVHQHSYSQGNPMRRFYRTFKNVFAVTFGSLDDCTKAATAVSKMHSRIDGEIHEEAGPYAKGFKYAATDETATIWVLATLIDYSVFMYELFCHPLSHEEKELYYQYTKQNAVVWGIDSDAMPLSWEDFLVYNGRMYHSSILTVTAPARTMFDLLVKPLPWERWSPISSTRLLLPVLLPYPLATQFGLKLRFINILATVVLFGFIRSIYQLLPSGLRCFPEYHSWLSRHNGGDGQLSFSQNISSSFGGWFLDSYLNAYDQSKS